MLDSVSYQFLMVVATLVTYFKFSANTFGFRLALYVLALSVGAVYSLSGLCKVCWGFVPSVGAGCKGCSAAWQQ